MIRSKMLTRMDLMSAAVAPGKASKKRTSISPCLIDQMGSPVAIGTLHLLVDAIVFIVSVALTASVFRFRVLFKGSIFATSWNMILASVVFLFAGVVVDLILMNVYGMEQLWMQDVQEVFIAAFLAFLSWGLYLNARQWRTMAK